MKYFLVTFVFISILYSCTKDKGLMPSVALTAGGTVDTACSTDVSYAQDIAPIVTNCCAFSGCHGVGQGSYNITTYADFKTFIQSYGTTYIISRISAGGGMPPSSSPGQLLGTCEFKKLRAWIQAGYPNN